MNSKLISFLGYFLIILVILITAPIAIPKLFDIKGYNVISGSMEPTMSVGSFCYVKEEEFDDLAVGDVIAYEAGASTVTHRITSIDTDSRLFTTKGDANDVEDFTPVAYVNVIGKVVAHVPFYGYVAAWLTDISGKIIAGFILIVGVLLSSFGEKSQKTEANKKRKVNPKIFLVLAFIFIGGGLISFGLIFYGYQKSINLYSDLNKAYVVTASEEVPEERWEDMIDVDFDDLQRINPDVVGWIYVEGTDISYPIMYSGDDEKYLHATLDGKYAKAGSIFLEGANNGDFSDSHSILYGHNMRNLTMFGSLKFYHTDKNYYDEHRYFQIITPESKMRYEIFSYFDTEAGSWVYTVPYSDSEEFEEYISLLTKYSHISQETLSKKVTSEDKVMTLSTCSTTGRRFTVHGVLMETKTIK